MNLKTVFRKIRILFIILFLPVFFIHELTHLLMSLPFYNLFRLKLAEFAIMDDTHIMSMKFEVVRRSNSKLTWFGLWLTATAPRILMLTGLFLLWINEVHWIFIALFPFIPALDMSSLDKEAARLAWGEFKDTTIYKT